MKCQRLLVLGCLAWLGVVPISVQAVRLAYHATANDCWLQQQTMKMSINATVLDNKYTMISTGKTIVTTTVKSVREDGSIIQAVGSVITALSTKLNGMEVTKELPTATKPYLLTLSPGGVLIDAQQLEKSIQSYPEYLKLLTLFPLPYPEKELQPGDTWDSTQKVAGVTVAFHGKLLAVDAEKTQTAKLDYTWAIPGANFARLLPALNGIPDANTTGKGFSCHIIATVDLAHGMPCAEEITGEVEGAEAAGDLMIPGTSTFTVTVTGAAANPEGGTPAVKPPAPQTPVQDTRKLLW